jgi:hypothetical protein
LASGTSKLSDTRAMGRGEVFLARTRKSPIQFSSATKGRPGATGFPATEMSMISKAMRSVWTVLP